MGLLIPRRKAVTSPSVDGTWDLLLNPWTGQRSLLEPRYTIEDCLGRLDLEALSFVG